MVTAYMHMHHLLQRFLPLARTNSVFLDERESGVVCTESTTRGTARVVHRRQQLKTVADVRSMHGMRGGCDRAVIALSAAHAATMRGVMHMRREHGEEMIHEEELDAMVFRAFWGFVNQFRPRAAAKLHVSELDLVVAHAAVCGVRIGMHRVLNPLNFKGEEVALEFRVTFTSRELANLLQPLLARVRESAVVVERGAILAEMQEEDTVFIDGGDRISHVYYAHAGEIKYLGHCAWGVENIVEQLSRYFAVPAAVVADILKRYTNNQVSEKVRRVIESSARKEMELMRAMVEKLARRARVEQRTTWRMVVHTPLSLAPDLFAGSRMQVIHAWADAQGEVERFLQYPYAHPQYAFLNQLLRRKVAWLTPHA